jgi:hypothetical protein
MIPLVNSNNILSKAGKDFNGEKLNENSIFTKNICSMGRIYQSGNVYKNLIELWIDGDYKRTSRMKSIKLIY